MAEKGKEGGSAQISDSEQGGGVTRRGDMVFGPDGKFAPGNRSGGRKPKAVERAYLDAVRDALPPEQISDLLIEALNMARETKSWRGMAEVIGIALAYGAGKPTQKTVTTDGNLEQLLAALASDAPLLPEVKPAGDVIAFDKD